MSTPKKKAAKKKAAPAKKAPAKKAPKSVDRHALAQQIEERLGRAMPDPLCELDHQDAWQLLVATILSAQSTDRMVNKVTPALFARFPTPAALAAADPSEIETLVKSTGFFRNKAKAIRGTAQALVERHGGEVPKTMAELVELPGVARKTANVVLSSAFRISAGFVVDTHVMRLSQRLALTRQTDPAEIEEDLCSCFPQPSWKDLAHRFTLHGRYTCIARAPMCGDCALNELCPSREGPPEDAWTERAERGSQRAREGVRLSRGD